MEFKSAEEMRKISAYYSNPNSRLDAINNEIMNDTLKQIKEDIDKYSKIGYYCSVSYMRFDHFEKCGEAIVNKLRDLGYKVDVGHKNDTINKTLFISWGNEEEE